MNGLRDKFLRLMNEYADELSEARRTNNFKRPFGALVRKEITGDIKKVVDPSIYTVKGSVGAGRWTDVPWIAVFDKRITTSAQRGVYIVYLLNKDTKDLFLTLNQGATIVSQQKDGTNNDKLSFTGIASSDNAKTTSILRERADNIRKEIGVYSDLEYKGINSGSKAYDAGCIYYKKYTPDDIPDDELLIKDLEYFIELYKKYYQTIKVTKDEGEVNAMTNKNIKETINAINNYISCKGFVYEDGLVENLYLCLKSKPFVILAGTSGTGKTRLAKLFAEAIGAKYKMVAVRPDWSDSSDLFGHVDLNGKFVPGAILDYIYEAQEDPEKPYILCLDEMNLARVEYYLSDFLSVIETRDIRDGEIVSDALVSSDKYADDADALEKYGDVLFPQNFYLIGTVNMDETTFPFSKKVLDRANTIEFNTVDLATDLPMAKETDALMLDNNFMKSKYLFLSQTEEDREYVADICAQLQKINEILQKANAHVGYRVRDEIVFYMLNNKETHLLSEENAMDNEILQKVLPRIQGSSASIKEMLCELFKYLAGDYEQYSTQTNDTASIMMKKIEDGGARYRRSAEKVAFMVKRFEEDGFTSYWL